VRRVNLLRRNDGRLFLNNSDIINVLPFAGIDFNYKDKLTSDYTVIVTGLVDPFGIIYIVNMFRKIIDGQTLPKIFFKLHREWQWESVGIDANANQITMKWLIESWQNRDWRDLYPGSNDSTKIIAPLITELESGGQNKYSLIESVCGANWRRIKFIKGLADFEELKTEFRELRSAKFDDIPDAITNLIRIVRPAPMVDLGSAHPRTGFVRRHGKKPETPIDILMKLDRYDRILAQ
jgi:hypothetical protein